MIKVTVSNTIVVLFYVASGYFFVDFIRVIEKVVKVHSSLDNMCKYLKTD